MTSEILPEFAHPDNAGQYFFTGPAAGVTTTEVRP